MSSWRITKKMLTALSEQTSLYPRTAPGKPTSPPPGTDPPRSANILGCENDTVSRR